MEPSGDINIINKYKRSQLSDLIPMLLEIQEYSGYITNDSLKEISKYLDIPISKIYGVSTFFNDIRFEKKGNFHIKVCRGTDCHINASESILNEISKQIGIKYVETTNDEHFSLEIS